ncbi:MAG: aldo/keto reductase [Clostridia bacterium]|nr:aldo/keto reductase [Clostridia bacterium]
MKYIDIAGKKAARIAFGSTNFGGSVEEGRAWELLDAYWQAGGNYLDTAHVYGDFVTPKNGESEKVIGRWMARMHNREKVFLSTKGAHHVLGTEPVGRLSREELKRDSSKSLEALQTDCVDIYWLHRDNPAYEVGEVMENLQALVEKGVTRLIGASNWSTERICEANAYARAHGLTPFYGNQPQFSLAIQGKPDDSSLVSADARMLKMHADTQMLMTPYSSQAKGFLTRYDVKGEEGLGEKARRRFLTPENLAIYARCKEVSLRTGLSVGALALLWLIKQPFPLVPLVGASRPEQLGQVFEAADADITPADRDYIRRI